MDSVELNQNNRGGQEQEGQAENKVPLQSLGTGNIEKNLEKRIVCRTEYRIKRKGFEDDEDEAKAWWVPKDHIRCKELIKNFEEAKNRTIDEEFNEESQGKKTKRQKNKDDRREVSLFDQGFEPVEILGAKEVIGGELMFLMKWANDKADLVPVRQANERCPQIVIKFYRAHITFTAARTSSDSD